ncbi:hypothetical protein GF352_00675 [archaeon]|nr:hypothetical protein [archaeon]
MNKYLELMRPRHLVGCALIFLMGAALFWRVNNYLNSNLILGLIAFLLTYSSVYIYNNLMDIEYDKKHYVKWKKERPLPKGLISESTAKRVIITNLVIGLTISFFINYATFMVNLGLFTLNFIYSAFRLKNNPKIGNIFIISSQFLKILNGWVVNSASINGLPLTIPLLYACIYGLLISIYKKKFFKSRGQKRKYMLVLGLITLSLIPASMIIYPTTTGFINKVIILLVIGAVPLKVFSKDVNKYFNKGLKVNLIVNSIVF